MISNDEEEENNNNNDTTTTTTPFWSLLVGRSPTSRTYFSCVLEDYDQEQQLFDHMPEIIERIQETSLRGYGVGYEWIFEPNKVAIEWPQEAVQTRYGGKFFWYGSDYLFRGGIEHNMNMPASGSAAHPNNNGDWLNELLLRQQQPADGDDDDNNSTGGSGIIVEEDNYLERVLNIQEERIRIHNDDDCGGGGGSLLLPTLEQLEGTYDILFYAGEYKYFLRHHRTSKGTLTLSTITAKEEEQEEEQNEERTATFNHRQRRQRRLEGKVEMDPTISNYLDIIPHGGNFTFVEKDRYQRVVIPKYHHNDTTNDNNNDNDNERRAPGGGRSNSLQSSPTVAGVIQIEVTQPPTGTLDMRYGRCIPNEFRGEMKQIKQKMALGLRRDCPLPYGEENEPIRVTTARIDPAEVEECIQENQKRKDTCLLWMRRRHCSTLLPPEVLWRIHDFITPPPYLILEEGDWVLSIDWSGGLPSYSANSCLIVRKRQEKDC